MPDETFFQAWVNKQQQAARQGKQRYLHFDPKIALGHERIASLRLFFNNPDKVASHAFYPFIKSDIIIPRYKKTGKTDAAGKPERQMERKRRPIAYAAHFDSLIYAWYSLQLTYAYEEKIKSWGIYDCVSAYLEKDQCNIQFAHEAFTFIRQKGACTALAFDISSFFDCLDHAHLKAMWCRVINETNEQKLPSDHFKVYQSLTQYTYVEKEALQEVFPAAFKRGRKTERICTPSAFRTLVRGGKLIESNPFTNKIPGSSRYGKKCGIPQGSPISACLSNVYMLAFDQELHQWVTGLGGLYRRYCDDILVIVDSEDADRVKQKIRQEILNHHLNINDDKTEVVVFKQAQNKNLRGFAENDTELNKFRSLQYLGFEFNGQHTYIRSSSLSRYHRRVSSRIRENLKAAYGKNGIGNQIFKKKLYNRYTSKGKRNFISYAKRASIYMDSPTIYKQYKGNLKIVSHKLDEKKIAFERRLALKGKLYRALQ